MSHVKQQFKVYNFGFQKKMKEIRIRKPKTISLENPPKLVILTTDQKYLIGKVKILCEGHKN